MSPTRTTCHSERIALSSTTLFGADVRGSRCSPDTARSIDAVSGPSNEQFEAAVIGGPAAHDETIDLVDYDLLWPELFDREAARIRARRSVPPRWLSSTSGRRRYLGSRPSRSSTSS